MHHLYSKLERAYSNLLEKVNFRWANQLVKIDRITLKKKRPPLKLNPVICISRDPGSGGKLVARKVSKKLGFTFYNKKLLEDLSKDMGKSSDVIAGIDEHTRSASDDFVHSLINPDYVSDVTFIKNLVKLMYKIAKRGKAVILGRGGSSILPAESCLDVRITAPESFRIKNAIKYEKLTREQAIKRVRKVTNRRADFVKQYFGQDINDIKLYDLVINTQQVSLDEAIDLIVKAYQKKFPKAKFKTQ